MSTERDRDDQEKTHHQYAKLITELPKTGGWSQPNLFLFQGYWLYPDAVLGAMLMQNHFKSRPNDIFLTSFMKSGTTWLRALMFSTLNRSRFDFSDHPLHHKGPHDCFPILDLYITGDYPITDLDVLPSPRLFASHFAHSLFPSNGCKFVYVCRDPKDVLVSMWYYMSKLRSREQPPLLLEQAFELFCEGVTDYGPYWDHVLGFWKASLEDPDKILFLKYEEMMVEPEVYVKRLAGFMGVSFSVEEEVDKVVEKIVNLCSFEHLKNVDVNMNGFQQLPKGFRLDSRLFFRRGEVGDWRNHLTEEMRERIDRITENKFKGSGLVVGATSK